MQPCDESCPLSRLLVLDLTRARSGPTAVRQLVDWGARVIQVQSPPIDGKDNTLGFDRDGSDYQNLHRNKQNIALDLRKEEGRALLYRLVEKADVVVENFRPGVKKRNGIDYETLSRINPRLVYASISGFGQDGPYAGRPGLDQIAQGLGGLMSITGRPGGGPLRVGIPIADIAAGLYCALGILTALFEREASGKGQWVRTSLLEAQIAMLDFQAARWLVEGEVPGQVGNDHPLYMPAGAFPTLNGYINLQVVGQDMWERFCATLQMPDLVDDPRFATIAARSENRVELVALIGEVTCRRSTGDWIDRLNAVGIPSGPILRVDEVFADPQVQHLAMTNRVVHDRLGPLEQVRPPVTMSRSRAHVGDAAPELGSGTREVLAGLGLGEAEIGDLLAGGAVYCGA